MNISALRQETPGCQQVIHLNNAGASLIPNPVWEASQAYAQEERMIGGYEALARNREALEGTYSTIASFLNAEHHEIALAENNTLAWDLAFHSLPFENGDLILADESSYGSNYIAYLQAAKRKQLHIAVIPSTATGELDLAALEQMLAKPTQGRPRLISITHMPTNGGLLQPAEAVGQLAKAHGCWYLLDACQTTGQYPLDVQKLGCHMLTATGRKYLRAPRGTGFLYISQSLYPHIEPIFLDIFSASWTGPETYTIRPDARRFENFEHNMANRMGLRAAVAYAQQIGIPAIWQRIQHLAQYLRGQVEELPNVLPMDLGKTQGGIVSMKLQQHDPEKLVPQLVERKVHTSVLWPGSTLLDTQKRQLPTMLRASVHYYNTEEEIDTFCQHLTELTTV